MKTKSVRFKISPSEKGYTLVELLAVIFILVAIGGVVMSIITSSLRGSNRSTNVNNIREEGDFAVTQMSKMVRFAKSFDGVSIDNINYVKDCTVTIPPTPTPVPPVTHYKYLKITSFDGGSTIFSCEQKNNSKNKPINTITSNSASLIDVENTQLDVDSCYFICNQDTVISPQTINIYFTLSKITNSTFSENKVNIPFTTSVTVRNTGD